MAALEPKKIAAPALPPEEHSGGLTRGEIMVILTVGMAALLQVIDATIVNVALPTMMGNLGATLDEIGWVVTGYIVTNAIVLPISGWLGIRFGRRSYLLTCILLFTAASVKISAFAFVNMAEVAFGFFDPDSRGADAGCRPIFGPWSFSASSRARRGAPCCPRRRPSSRNCFPAKGRAWEAPCSASWLS